MQEVPILWKQLQECHPQNRGDKQIRSVMEQVQKEKYFADLTMIQLLQISGKLECSFVEKGSNIYQTRDYSDCFYVLLKGQVDLTIPSFEEQQCCQSELEPALTNRQKQPLIQGNQSVLVTQQSTTKDNSKNVLANKITLSQSLVQIINEGQCFGQMCMGELSRRGTSAYAHDSCYLIVLKRNCYDCLSRAHTKSVNRIKFQLLKLTSIYKHIYKYSLESFFYLMEEVPCCYNKLVYSENQCVSHVYIIAKGDFVLSVNVEGKTVVYKHMQPGNILGEVQEHFHIDSLVCKSQYGLVYAIKKQKFMKKIFAPDNDIDQIQILLTQTLKEKEKNIQNIKKHNILLLTNFLFKNRIFSSSKSNSITIKQHQYCKTDHQFFTNVTKTITPKMQTKRFSVNRVRTECLPIHSKVPQGIKDIVQIVHFKGNYQKLRKPQLNRNLFSFDIQKVPLYVRKKYIKLFVKKSNNDKTNSIDISSQQKK